MSTIYISKIKHPPRNRPFLGLIGTMRYVGPPGTMWEHGEPVWKELFYIDGKFSVYCGFNRVWTTEQVNILCWMESPPKPSK